MKYKVGDRVRLNKKAVLRYNTILTKGQVVIITEVQGGLYVVGNETFLRSELSELTKLEKALK